MPRNAYILSGILHATALALLFLMAQAPRQSLAPMRRYQPVRLVAPAGPPGPAMQAKPKTEPSKPVERKEKPQPAAKTTTKQASPVNGQDKAGTKSAQEKPAVAKGGGGGGSVNLEGANFPYPYYLNNIQIKILSNFKPAVSARQAKELKAVVFFVIDKSGRISEIKLEDKSGHFIFDQEAQRAILRSNPLPALPPAFGSDRLGVHFEFVGTP
jgi:colicin import membrane protein